MNNHSIPQLLIFIITAIIFCPPQSQALSESTSQTHEIELINEANEAFWKRDFACARNTCLQLLDSQPEGLSKGRIFVNLAICDAQLDDLNLAAKEAKQGIDRPAMII